MNENPSGAADALRALNEKPKPATHREIMKRTPTPSTADQIRSAKTERDVDFIMGRLSHASAKTRRKLELVAVHRKLAIRGASRGRSPEVDGSPEAKP